MKKMMSILLAVTLASATAYATNQVNFNFTTSAKPLPDGEHGHGIILAPKAEWLSTLTSNPSDTVTQEYTWENGLTSTVSASWSAGGYTVNDYVHPMAIMEGASFVTNTITIEGMNFGTYDAYVFFHHSDEGKKWVPVGIVNGEATTWYRHEEGQPYATEIPAGNITGGTMTPALSTTLAWGSRDLTTTTVGKNVIRIQGLTSPTFVAKFVANVPATHSNICAVQLVETLPLALGVDYVESDLVAPLWSGVTWNEAKVWADNVQSTATLVVTENTPVAFDFDTAIVANRVAFESATAMTKSLTSSVVDALAGVAKLSFAGYIGTIIFDFKPDALIEIGIGSNLEFTQGLGTNARLVGTSETLTVETGVAQSNLDLTMVNVQNVIINSPTVLNYTNLEKYPKTTNVTIDYGAVVDFGTLSGEIVATGKSLTVAGTLDTKGTITNNGTLSLNNSELSFNKTIAGTGSIVVSGNPTFTIAEGWVGLFGEFTWTTNTVTHEAGLVTTVCIDKMTYTGDQITWSEDKKTITIVPLIKDMITWNVSSGVWNTATSGENPWANGRYFTENTGVTFTDIAGVEAGTPIEVTVTDNLRASAIFFSNTTQPVIFKRNPNATDPALADIGRILTATLPNITITHDTTFEVPLKNDDNDAVTSRITPPLIVSAGKTVTFDIAEGLSQYIDVAQGAGNIRATGKGAIIFDKANANFSGGFIFDNLSHTMTPIANYGTGKTFKAIGAGGVLDINEAYPSNFKLTVQDGATITRTGAPVNIDLQQAQALSIPSGTGTVSGSGHWGLISSSYGATTLTIAPRAKLVKKGTNTFYLYNTTVTNSRSQIDIQGGTVRINYGIRMSRGMINIAKGATLNTSPKLELESITGEGTVTGSELDMAYWENTPAYPVVDSRIIFNNTYLRFRDNIRVDLTYPESCLKVKTLIITKDITNAIPNTVHIDITGRTFPQGKTKLVDADALKTGIYTNNTLRDSTGFKTVLVGAIYPAYVLAFEAGDLYLLNYPYEISITDENGLPVEVSQNVSDWVKTYATSDITLTQAQAELLYVMGIGTSPEGLDLNTLTFGICRFDLDAEGTTATIDAMVSVGGVPLDFVAGTQGTATLRKKSLATPEADWGNVLVQGDFDATTGITRFADVGVEAGYSYQILVTK